MFAAGTRVRIAHRRILALLSTLRECAFCKAAAYMPSPSLHLNALSDTIRWCALRQQRLPFCCFYDGLVSIERSLLIPKNVLNFFKLWNLIPFVTNLRCVTRSIKLFRKSVNRNCIAMKLTLVIGNRDGDSHFQKVWYFSEVISDVILLDYWKKSKYTLKFEI